MSTFITRLEVVKRIRENEIELADRTTVLRGIKPNVRLSFDGGDRC